MRIDGPVVVTGGAGFLGAEVLRQLQALSCSDVRVIDVAPFPGAVPERVRFFRGDLRSFDMTEAFAGAKTVLHLAACQYHTPLAKRTYDLPFFEVNVEGTRRVIEAAVGAKAARLVFVSTNMVYGLPQRLPLSEDHPRAPFGPYGQSKLAAERLVESALARGLDAAIVRPGLIVGPGRTGVVARVFDWILANRPVWLIGNGKNRYEMMASADVASLVLHAGAAKGFGVYNCRAREVPTMREWIEAVIARAGSTSRVVGVPGRPVKIGLRALEALRIAPLRRDQYLIADLDYHLDAERARVDLGWSPRWSGTEAVLETFRWYTAKTASPGGQPVATERPS